MDAVTGPNSSLEAQLTQMVEEYQTPLLHMCYMYLHDNALAEDAVQETFLKAYRNLPLFRGECTERTWLMRIAVNTCRDMTKSAWFRHTDRRVTPEELPQAAAPQNEYVQELAEQIAGLPARYKDAILLYYYQDMTVKEVADALSCTPSTISRRLETARRKLRDVLERGQNHGR